VKRALLVVSLVLVGCGRTILTPLEGDPTTGLPTDGVRPLEVSEFCKADDEGHFPLREMVIGAGWRGPVAFAYGGGCVGRSLRDTQAALHNGEALHWVGTDLLGFARIPDERVPFVFERKYKAGPPLFAQKWTMQWFHSEKDARVFVRFKKTEGSSYIARWDGTIELVSMAPNVTGFAMRNEIEAARTGVAESVGSVRDQLMRVRTVKPDYSFLGR